jgi:GMP synthase PP-ATPase subunit
MHLLARWIQEQKGGHFEDDQNIEILEELDSIFKNEIRKETWNRNMSKRMAYFLVIKRVIELQDQIKGK